MSNDALSLNKLYALLGKVVQFSGFGEQSQASILQGLTQHTQYQEKYNINIICYHVDICSYASVSKLGFPYRKIARLCP